MIRTGPALSPEHFAAIAMPRPKINDSLPLTMSRQWRYQIRKMRQRRCIICGKKAVTKLHCEIHRKQNAAIALASYYRRNKK